MPVLLALALVGSFGLASLAVLPAVAHAEGARTYRARGTITAIGAERRSVTIAHEKIEGVMPAMTMSFDARSAGQLAGFTVGDRVDFSFTATDDGRRLLVSITRRADTPRARPPGG